ncbi:MAG: hypothetical protein H6745_12610 [Deltaproteobacteria bacterium]|nr:hypothetical protein [Deltaproteobacteria bacterium]
MKRILLLSTLVPVAALAAGCGIDPLIWGNATKTSFDPAPEAGTQTVSGMASLLPSATVSFYSGAGAALADQATTSDANGAFSADFPAITEFVNTVVSVAGPARNVLGIVPQVPKKTSVYDESVTVTLGTDVSTDTVPFMADLGVEATAATLIMLAKVQNATPPSNLGAVSPDALISALEELDNLVGAGDARVQPFVDMVERLLADGATTKPAFRPFPAGASFLDASALASGTDYTGDDTADTDTAAFDQALATAVGALEFDVCYPDDRIRLVLICDFREGGKDRNGSTINRWKWTVDEAGKQMFITGALHESTPNCATDDPPCVTSANFDAAGQLMGNWSPNIIPMYDDGTHGDAVAGDSVWTITFDMPWFNAGDPANRWVRIGYKYTWGTPGHLWTGTEEWPGNQRILELRDVNGDHLIVRQDLYGDETTNKDKSNLLAPAKGGCGTVLWASDLNPPPDGRRENCVDDTVENMIDTDGDGTLDSYPTLFNASPITIPCAE